LIQNELLDSLVKLAPILQDALPFDAMIGITDKEKFLLYLPSEQLNFGAIPGMAIPEGDAIYEAIRTNKPQLISVPGEIFGIPFKAKGITIKDTDGNVIGGLGIGVSLDNQVKLNDMAQQFSATSEEISASTEELSSAAHELSGFMGILSASQTEMIDQVNRTEGVLELIKAIGRNSRILGLNAGIEAARSGEHGLGFGVVAKEITKLADNTAKSVAEIQNLLEELKEKVGNIAETVDRTSEISYQQSASTEEISSAINQLSVAAENLEKLSEII